MKFPPKKINVSHYPLQVTWRPTTPAQMRVTSRFDIQSVHDSNTYTDSSARYQHSPPSQAKHLIKALYKKDSDVNSGLEDKLQKMNKNDRTSDTNDQRVLKKKRGIPKKDGSGRFGWGNMKVVKLRIVH